MLKNLDNLKIDIIKPSEKIVLSKISDLFKKNKTFFIAGHIKPDGDTVGSSLALAALLRRLGKKVEIYSRDPLPDYLKFLHGTSKISISNKVEKKYDCAIILECANAERMGDIISLDQARYVINIDHHVSYNHFGHVNFIDPVASSSAEMIYKIFRFMKVKLTPDDANALYAGLVTDTGKFQQTNTTPQSMLVGSVLQVNGVKPCFIYEKIYATKSVSSLKLLGAALSTLKVNPSGKVASIEITQSMFKKTGSNSSETEEIINYAMMASGVLVAVLLCETKTPGLIKVSMRSKEKYDVNKIAKRFGGGGHKNASGCSIKGTIESVSKIVVREINSSLSHA